MTPAELAEHLSRYHLACSALVLGDTSARDEVGRLHRAIVEELGPTWVMNFHGLEYVADRGGVTGEATLMVRYAGPPGRVFGP